ncbi:TetR/AcrR family transcriptional regulator [Indiicoccus explosivorum]|uniref:TetR/AcrR family transcriptional regulator n=1 Tax=Indiicoccus explosivorum TaxID=1917864 RepID=UPI000B447961|nr:TetR/AcrR family transcriptional regulator [Indiicoccus explosivorum]
MSLREKKAAKKREDILRSASLVIARQGYQHATMEDIAAELLMTKGSLYYYFKNKQELLFYCHDLILSKAISKMEKIQREDISAEDKIKKAIKAHVAIAIEEKEIFNLIIEPEQIFSEEHIGRIIEKRDRYTGFFDQFIEEGIRNGEFNLKQKKMARMMIMGAVNWTQVWYSAAGEYDKKEIQTIYAEYLVKMLV